MFTPNPDFTEATNAAFADFDARLSKVEADMQKCSEQGEKTADMTTDTGKEFVADEPSADQVATDTTAA